MLEKGNKKIINAWAFYDWANSSYPLVITTAIFPLFYEATTGKTVNGVKTDLVTLFGRTFHNTELYDYTIALSFLIVSISTPLLSGIADYSGSKRKFMQFFCYLGSLSCASLYFFDQSHLGLSLFTIMLTSVGFWGSLVFYNAFLPEIAEPADHDRVSAKGYSLGYIGSSILLIINLIAIQGFHMDPKWSFVSVAIWWMGFAQITFARLPNNVYGRKPEGNVIFKGFRELYKVWLELKEISRLKRYLASFFIYSMGVQTVMIIAVPFASKEIFPPDQKGNLIIAVLIIQFLGVGGSILFSRLSKWIGNIKALGVSLFIWIGICIGTYLWVFTPSSFYVVAALVGLVMGGIQSLSRSTYSKLLPETEDHASYFSFYDVCEKIGIAIGTLSFGLIEGLTGGMRNSILTLIAFFVVGFILLLTIPKSKAIEV
jgi:UMF1 family MFS transporter